jgi:transcriptional regulator with XRE-family HTH domain
VPRSRPIFEDGKMPTTGKHARRSERKSMNRTSAKPFGEALRELMDARGLTYRGLADAIRELDAKGISHAHINMLANGHDKPSMRAMELIARACGVQPDYFAEYRLAVAMRELDPNEVGLEQALENLNARLGARRRAAAKSQPAPRRRARPRPTG